MATETCVPDQLTPSTPRELYTALQTAWPQVVPDSEPARGSVLILVAHWGLETGFGHFCHCFNLANKKHVKGDGRNYCMFRCNEVLNGQTVWFDPPDPATWFVAFDTLRDGAADYLAGLHKHFGAAWLDVVADEPARFCHDLKLEHYYTADEAIYTSGLVRCFHQLDASIPPDPSAAALAHDALLQAGIEIDETVHDKPPPPTDA